MDKKLLSKLAVVIAVGCLMAAGVPVGYATTYTEYEFEVKSGSHDVQYNPYDDEYYTDMTQMFASTGSYRGRLLIRFRNVTIPRYADIEEWGIKYYIPSAYAGEATDSYTVGIGYEVHVYGSEPALTSEYLDNYPYNNGAVARWASEYTRATAGNNTVYIGAPGYGSSLYPDTNFTAGQFTVDVVIEAAQYGETIAFNSYESGNIPVLYVKVSDYEAQSEVIKEIRDYTIVKRTPDVVYYGFANPNLWVNLPVLIQVPAGEAELVDATTYNSSWIQPDLPYGEPWGNETYEGEYYDELILTQACSYQVQISRCESTDTGKRKIGIFGFERTWGTQTASNIPILYIAGFSKVYSGSFANRVTNGAFYVGTEIRSYDANTVELNVDSTTASAEAQGADLYLDEGKVYLMHYWVGYQFCKYGGSNYNYHYRNNFYEYNQTTGSITYEGHVEYHFNASDYGDINRVELMESYGGGAFDAYIEAYVTRGFVPETAIDPYYEVYDEDDNLVGIFDTLEQAENWIFAQEPEWSENSMEYVHFIGLVGAFIVPIFAFGALKDLNLKLFYILLVVECCLISIAYDWILTVAT